MKTRRFEKTTAVGVPAADLFDWHMRPGALTRLSPPWQPVEVVGELKPPSVGDRVSLKMGNGPLRVKWVAGHTDVEDGRSFEDVQIEGPFKVWRHRHSFEPAGEEESVLRDSIEYKLPLGALGSFFGEGFVRRSLERAFVYRHETTQADLEFHDRYKGAASLRVAITGSSGLIGSSLSSFLTTGGHTVVPIVRKHVEEDSEAVQWAPDVGIVDLRKLEGIDVVVHLAGENISEGRWTAAKKERIRSSRIDGTRNLVESLSKLSKPPQTFLTASAIGYYGDRGDEVVDETSSSGEGFLAEVCKAWEEVVFEEVPPTVRTLAARFGVVMTPQGGALAKMLPAFKLGGGGTLGNGRQFMSWVSIDDVVGALTHMILTPELSGAVNVVSPKPVRNSEFTKTLAKVLRRPAIVPMPAPMARLLFGQMADEALLASTRVEPSRLIESGFQFRDPDLEPSLRRLLGS